MTTLFVIRLTVIDASLLDPELGLLGESWLVDVELNGSLDPQGMALDFALVKRQIKEIIVRHFDHKLLVPSGHPRCRVLHKGRKTEITLRLDSGTEIHHLAPDSATTLVAATEINPDTPSGAIVERIRPTLPTNVEQLRCGSTLKPSMAPGTATATGLNTTRETASASPMDTDPGSGYSVMKNPRLPGNGIGPTDGGASTWAAGRI